MQNAHTPVTRKFTVADFHYLGQRNGFAYCLPEDDSAMQINNLTCIAEGWVQEIPLRHGLNLVLSDIAVNEAYAATSVDTPQLCAIVMLQGQARTEIKHCGFERLTANSGISALYSDASPMTGYHPAGQRMLSVNLSLSNPDAVDDERLAALFDDAVRHNGTELRRWPVPAFLMLSLARLFQISADEAGYPLLAEGVGLQLLAHALGALDQPIGQDAVLSERDRKRLERVREHLHDMPGEEHSLTHLAQLAYMSPSALRAKFQTAYQCSVFSYLRERRLEVARVKLTQGYSVQQAAHLVGYRHATNFSTAFRQRYGMSPSELH